MSDVSGIAGSTALPSGTVNEPQQVQRLPLEQRTAVSVTVLVALAGQAAIPQGFGLSPWWLLPGVAASLVLIIAAGGRWVEDPAHPGLRSLALSLAAVLALGNLLMVMMLVRAMLDGQPLQAAGLFTVGAVVWVTNVVAFAVALWEIDAGGPVARTRVRLPEEGELLFPQYSLAGREQWSPRFSDYLYVSFTNATAFSPTDTLPLTVRVKLLMALQSAVALVAVAVVFARGVNIIGA
mgnify:CR=1 FL=1